MAADKATVEVFWRAYETLKPEERRMLAERILRDRRLLADLFDHALIEKAKRTRGKAVRLEEYEAVSKTAGL